MKYFLAACFFVVFSSISYAFPRNGIVDGYPLSNFAVTANVSQDGDLFGRIFQNPGQLGHWLSDRGALPLSIEKGDTRIPLSAFPDKTVTRLFPFVTASYAGGGINSAIGVRLWAPSGINDLRTTTLPVIQMEFTLENPSDSRESFALVWEAASFLGPAAVSCKSQEISGVADSLVSLVCDGESYWNGSAGELRIPVSLERGQRKVLRVALVLYDPQWVTAQYFPGPLPVAGHVFSHWDELRSSTERFEAAIPSSGDSRLDTCLRWYMIPGMALTKCTAKGEIVTMGYCELNQRDSYWASWLHLVFFRDAERKMIEESIAFQTPSGKIPTTVLPLIDRNDDLDINAFFILRVQRYASYYDDRALIADNWPALKKAADWLVSRDEYGDGLPVQRSFWGDWKDVAGVKDRKYSPFSGLLYLAAMQRMEALSSEMNDTAAKKRYREAFRKGYAFINSSDAKGGLWNGNYYRQQWHDGRIDDKLLQDQTIGILFGVVPGNKARRIIASLNEMSLTPYGVCETFPYYPAEFGYAPGTYHNGAVWPWISFVDAWARLRMGRRDEAVDLVKRVAHADLAASGDWSANEHINSLTGENLGFQIQGWDAGLFGLVYFGLCSRGMLP